MVETKHNYALILCALCKRRKMDTTWLSVCPHVPPPELQKFSVAPFHVCLQVSQCLPERLGFENS